MSAKHHKRTRQEILAKRQRDAILSWVIIPRGTRVDIPRYRVAKWLMRVSGRPMPTREYPEQSLRQQMRGIRQSLHHKV